MGKGMKAGKRPKQPKMGNAQQMAQMQAMQREMDKVQEEIEQMETTATSGGGAVTVTVTGKKEIKDIQIRPEACDPDDVDIVIPANDDAIRAVKLIASKMADAVIEGNQGESFDEGEDEQMTAAEGNDAPAEDIEEVAEAAEEE